MGTQIYVNLPVTDLARSVAFYGAVGFRADPNMTDENATGMKVTDTIYVMLLTQTFFGTFTDKPIADATAVTEVITAISVDTREEVDQLADAAVAAGGGRFDYRAEMDGMHGRAFIDPDGHQWEVIWTDPSLFGG